MNKQAANPSSDRYDVAVIGAGPAGSSAASALAAAGWRVALIERKALPHHKVCGEFLSPDAQATLRVLGLHQVLAALAPRVLTGATLTSHRGGILTMSLPGAAWGLSRYAMDAALADAAVARGAVLLAETTVIDLAHDDQGVTLTLRDKVGTRFLCARTAIMAGGRMGTAKLPPAATAQPRKQLFVGIKSHFAGLAMPDHVELFLFDGGYVGINPVETGAANVCLLVRYAEFARAGRTVDGIFAAIARQNPSFARRMEGAQPLLETRCTVAAVDTNRPAAPWVEMACLGDTATMIPPLSGDGMAMALRSAEICVPLADDYLRGACTMTAWRDQYRVRWHTEFDSRLRIARGLQKLFWSPVIADALIPLGRVAPWLANFVVRSTRGAV